jgi:hypothetical protein
MAAAQANRALKRKTTQIPPIVSLSSCLEAIHARRMAAGISAMAAQKKS